ncbi:serine/threonine-protein kinase Chk2 isoform X2 [Neoarius graeffei]|uniref:serine/threonine-protein kinase Chk2 isoform X2 n=1 Tax=Neoarius graeffei TaxID=443677 RepID=UPI00298C2B3D|nr:serine/threonine-protein kinase Chk2 isoform X2 [Neoarius graeffei]
MAACAAVNCTNHQITGTCYSMSDEPGPSKQTHSQTHSQSQTQSQPSSSSSSAPASSSQSSSSGSGTLSSVDTVPIAELSSIPEEPEEPEPKYWGRIVPLIRGFNVLNCVENQYYFGRDSRNDYCFNDPIVVTSPRYRTYSKRHFKIFRDESVVYLEDLSGNGTWVDDTEVGNGKRCPLRNNSVVSLADPKHKVFMFVDMTEDDQPNFPKEFREKYHVTRKIGSGVCGEVKLAIERETCKKVAVKTINKNDFPSVGTVMRNAEREIEILKKIDHPCLIRTEDFYQTQDSYYIVLEYVEGGDLFSRIKAQKQLKEGIAKLYFFQMLKAVEYLHENGIIHRDLKPENVLLTSHDDECLIKITDFNQSKILEESSLMKTLCGTPTFLAPEVFTADATGGYTHTVDCWSLGVLLFICLGGYPPFNSESSSMSVRDQIISGHYCFIRSRWESVSTQAKDLVKKLLVVDPNKRLSISEALQHPWINDEEIKQMALSLMYPTQPNEPIHPGPSRAGLPQSGPSQPEQPQRRSKRKADKEGETSASKRRP